MSSCGCPACPLPEKHCSRQNGAAGLVTPSSSQGGGQARNPASSCTLLGWPFPATRCSLPREQGSPNPSGQPPSQDPERSPDAEISTKSSVQAMDPTQGRQGSWPRGGRAAMQALHSPSSLRNVPRLPWHHEPPDEAVIFLGITFYQPCHSRICMDYLLSWLSRTFNLFVAMLG